MKYLMQYIYFSVMLFALGPLLRGGIANFQQLNGQLKLLASALLVSLVLVSFLAKKNLFRINLIASNLAIYVIIIAVGFFVNSYSSEMYITSKYLYIFCGLSISLLFAILIKIYSFKIFFSFQLIVSIILGYATYFYIFPDYFEQIKYLNIFSYLFYVYIFYQLTRAILRQFFLWNPNLLVSLLFFKA